MLRPKTSMLYKLKKYQKKMIWIEVEEAAAIDGEPEIRCGICARNGGKGVWVYRNSAFVNMRKDDFVIGCIKFHC